MSDEHLLISRQRESLVAIDAADLTMAAAIAERARKLCPGHPWAVTGSHHDGIFVIKHLLLSEKYGFVMHVVDLKNTADFDRLVRQATGELLERWNIKRGLIDLHTFDHIKPWHKPRPGLGM